MQALSTEHIAELVRGELVGPGDLVITAVQQLDEAQAGHLTLIRDQANAPGWADSKASAAIVGKKVEIEPGDGRALIRVEDADAALNVILNHFAPSHGQPEQGVHTTAVVDSSTSLPDEIAIGPGCVIGRNVRIGEGCVLHANVVIFDDAVVGEKCTFFPGAVVGERCVLGDDVVLHSNVVIGTDGFGYLPPDAKNPQAGAVKIPHLGTVKIGDHVEIGAGTCIDRGKFAATEIGSGTKIDNLCQIGHNCRIGRCCMLSGQVGIAGSVTIGDGVVMGGKVAIKDHVKIGDGATLAGMSGVMNDIPAGETWGGTPAQEYHIAVRNYAAMRKLPELLKLLKKDRKK